MLQEIAERYMTPLKLMLFLLLAYMTGFGAYYWPPEYFFEIKEAYYLVYAIKLTCIASVVLIIKYSHSTLLAWCAIPAIPLALWNELILSIMVIWWSIVGFAP